MQFSRLQQDAVRTACLILIGIRSLTKRNNVVQTWELATNLLRRAFIWMQFSP